jgi:hypothetical protein
LQLEKDSKKNQMSLDYFITMKEGVASTTAIALNTDHTVVVGEGEINLKTEKLNLSVKPVPKKGIGTRLTGKLNVSLSVFTRPFNLGGTLAHPHLLLIRPGLQLPSEGRYDIHTRGAQ